MEFSYFEKANFLFVLILLSHVQFIRSEDEPSPPDAADGGGEAPPSPAGDGGGDAPPSPGGDNGGGGAAAPPSGPKTEFMSPAPWIRICASGKYIGAASPSKDECPAGYWFKESTKVGCVCGHGVWLFAKGWCDHQARIVIAYNGSCFNVNKDVKYVRQLGWPHDAFMPFHFVGTSGLEYVQDVPVVSTMFGRSTFFHKEYAQHIGAVFREKAVEAMTSRFCMSPDGNVTRTFAMKYFVPKLPYLQKRVCFSYAGQDTSRFEYDAGYELNEGLQLVDAPPKSKTASWATEADSNKCLKECPSAKFFNPNPPRNQSLLPDYRDPIYDEEFLDELKEMGWNNSAPMPTEMPEQNCSRVYALSNKTTDEIREQTLRMTQFTLAALLADEIVPNVKYVDYKLMQKARKIFDAVCPEKEFPSKVLEGMMRMFRIAVNESFFHYPFNQLGDKEQTMRIWEVLDKCEKEAKPMEFIYKPLNVTNETDECPGPVKFVGVRYEFGGENGLNRTIMTKMPCHLKANITDLDLVVETAWKTVMFTHYYCARHFSNSSLGFSVFEQKMERFFNRWIQHRWFYPGLSFGAYEYVFQNGYNLTEFVLALDRCVAAARTFSVYRKWIQRPSYLRYMGDKLFEEQFDIPDKIAGRTSLDAINPKLNKFNNKAYCLPFWHTPVSNPALDYNPDGDYKPGCVKYRKEEWQTPYNPAIGMSNGWRNTIDIY